MNYTQQAGNWQQEQQPGGAADGGGAAAAAATGAAAAGSAREGNIINRNQEAEGGPSRSTFVTLVEDNDVLMGRGAPIVDNEGNIRFRQLIRSRLSDYQAALSRKEKDDIARQIAATVRGRSGLFLRKIETQEEAQSLGVPSNTEPGGTGTAGGAGAGGAVAAWTCVDESQVLVKVKQALRDQGLESEQEDKKKKSTGAGGGGPASSSPRRGRNKRVKLTSSQSGGGTAGASPTTELGGGGGREEPDHASTGGQSDVKVPAAAAPNTTKQPAEFWQQASNTAMQLQHQQQQPSSSFAMSDAAAAAVMGRGSSSTQQALLLNQLRQQELRQQQYELEQRRHAAGLGFFDSAVPSSSGGGGSFPYSPLGGQGVLGGSVSRGGTMADGGGGGGGSAANMFGGMASIPELTNMENSNLLRRGSAGSSGNTNVAATAMMNEHLSGLRPGPRSLLNTAAPPSLAMHYQEDYRVSPPGRASMGGGGGGLSQHADVINNSLAHATNFYLGRPQLGGDMMMGGGVCGGGINASSLLSGGGGGFMGANPMMRRGQEETTIIETVLQHASKLCQQLHAITSTTIAGDGGGRKRFPDHFLSLTQIELCIVTVLCSSGLPLWQNATIKSAPAQTAAAASALDNSNDNSISWSAAFTLTWVNVANQVLKEASVKAASGNKNNSMSLLPPPPPPIHGGDHPFKDSSSSSLVAVASHYCKNPKELAQATVMLLEKIRQHGDYDNSAAARRTNSFMSGSAKSDQAADAFLLSSSAHAPLKKEGYGGMMRPGLFLEAELGRWGTSLDVADSVGNPVAFCNADFLSSYPHVLRHDIMNICAVLDAASCTTLFNHVANLSRLRDTFQKVPKDHLLVSLGQQASLDPSSMSSSLSMSSYAFLDRLPGTSQEERAHLDYSLLRSILDFGFLGFFRNTPMTENLLLLTLRRAGLTKAAMEQRATLLIQALHAHFDSRKRKSVIEEHNGKVAGLIAMAMASSSATT